MPLDPRIEGYARGLFEVARAEGNLDEVEAELYRFARFYERSEELREVVTDDKLPPAQRQSIIERLFGEEPSTTTTQLVSMVLGSGRGKDLPAIIDRLVERSADAKRLVAGEVRSAVELTEDQVARIKEALVRTTGRQINLKTVVDPTILGGICATVGDTVIDGSVRHRLDQIKGHL